jgi:SAM-dependent methyltransferase
VIAPPLTAGAWLRYDLIIRALRRVGEGSRILEVGAGEGAMGVRLAQTYDYTGLEPDPVAFGKAQARMRRSGRGTVLNRGFLGFPGESSFAVVCAFEVLEHIKDDGRALDAWWMFLKPGGWLILSVPAWCKRFARGDAHVGHYRRYDPADIVRLLLAHRYVAVHAELVGFPLGYALEACRNVLARTERVGGEPEQRSAASGRWLQPGGLTGWATFAIAWPFRVMQTLPGAKHWGTGLVVAARRPGDD